MECCGVLVGRGNEIVESIRSGNLADDPARRFLLDPAVHIRAIHDARARGFTIVGFYHSHPASDPRPSATDVECATYPDHLYLIVRPFDERCDARMYRSIAAGFVEESMIVT